MRCANSFCSIVILYCIVHLCTAVPVNLHENGKSDGYIVEIDPSMLHAVELNTKKPVRYVTAMVRNKRHFDYIDYSISSEEDNGFGRHVPKPYFRGFTHFWRFPTTIRTGYDYWHPRPTIPYSNVGYNYFPPHHHHHHFGGCKYPFDDSAEYEENDSSEKPDFPQTTTTVASTTSTTTTTVPSTTSPTTTTTAPTTTTEYIPVIDIRSSN